MLLAPDGTRDSSGRRFWNAGACCDFDRSGVDDLAYISGLIGAVRAVHAVDPRRIYLVGFSNGGHMAHRLGCALASQLAAVVSIAGAAFDLPSCAAEQPVSVLQIQDPNDPIVPYQRQRRVRRGGMVVDYPGARGSIQRWIRRNSCLEGLDPIQRTIGPVRFERQAGCPPGIDIELWSIDGVAHSAHRMPDFTRRVWRWLAAHPKVDDPS
jgi:polyhydroxybutyrate depolymerase